ncbi:hypothetical protein C8Q74DRAFT_414111 [Fomes fomentarius]|nr:hypothetical protein C8Q74DRAFT_414111 [Fomes fomentarius]
MSLSLLPVGNCEPHVDSSRVNWSFPPTLYPLPHNVGRTQYSGDRNAAGLWGMGPIAALGARRLQNGKPAALSNLKKLKLEQDTVCIKFPRNYFGDAVVHLHLNLYFQISTELLQCIQNLHRLQTLDIKLYSQYSDDADDLPFRTKISTLPSILTSVSSGSALHALSISCYPASPPNILWSYCLGRSSLLDILVGADMRKVLNGFPSLSKLIFKLFENDEGYDNVWWKEEMVRRLPSHLQAAVMIELLQMDFNSYLWLSMHEIRTRHTQKNPIDISIIKNGLALAFNNPSPLLPQLDQIDEDEDEEEEEEEDEDDEEKDTLKQQSTGSHPQQTHPSPTPEYLSWAIDEDLGGKTLDAEHWSDSRFLHADNLGETVSHVPHSELPLSTYSEIAAALEPYH